MNTGQSRSVFLTGNIHDLFRCGKEYVPLISVLCSKYSMRNTETQKGITIITYEINGEIEIIGDHDAYKELSSCWNSCNSNEKHSLAKTISQKTLELKEFCRKAKGNPTFALELLRLITHCAQVHDRSMKNNLLVIIEGADMLLPDAELSRMQIADRTRVSIVHDWFCDPKFMNGNNSVILLSESKSLVHHRISRLPQMLNIEVSEPNHTERLHFIEGFLPEEKYAYRIASLTAGLSLHALRQLLCQEDISQNSIAKKIEEYIVSQLGEGTVEFKKPTHKFKDVIGFTNIKNFMKTEVIPRFLAGPEKALPGAVFCGPIGGGKTFLGEALAAELEIPVLVLKNLRSKWFGETDIIFERLKRTLNALDKVLIFVDEADTQFGDLSSESHATERRLTGNIQTMMSDTQLRGKVMWLLMTARVHLLSPDIRRPGRVGDLIIPILDPVGQDFSDFIDWVISDIDTENADRIDIKNMFTGCSAADFSSIRSQIKALDCKTIKDLKNIMDDRIASNLYEVRKYQKLQAKVNCTRRCLLSYSDGNKNDFDARRRRWQDEITKLELQGVS